MIPYGRQYVDDADIAEVVRVLKGDMLTTGPEVPAFERAFAEYVGAPYAVACANGTAALHVIALALGLGPGDQVIVPTLSFVATANAPHYCGAEVIFADVDPESGHATVDSIREAIGRADPKRLKAIFVVHLAGSSVDVPGVAALAKAAGVPLIEDACHAIGSNYRGAMGTIGDCQYSAMAAFSFHPVKTLTTGEGGAVTTRDPELAKKLALLHNHGLVREASAWVDKQIGFDPVSGSPNVWAYELQLLGYNYRLTDFQAALGRSQLKKMPEFSAARRRLARRYRERFAAFPETARIAACSCDDGATLHLMVALIDFDALGTTRGQFMQKLRDLGVGTQVHYIPIHRQPYYAALAQPLHLGGAEEYYRRCLSLPLFASMTDANVDRVADAVGAAIK